MHGRERSPLPSILVQADLAGCPNPALAPHKNHAAEQVPLDIERVEPRHVPRRLHTPQSGREQRKRELIRSE